MLLFVHRDVDVEDFSQDIEIGENFAFYRVLGDASDKYFKALINLLGAAGWLAAVAVACFFVVLLRLFVMGVGVVNSYCVHFYIILMSASST